MDGLSDMINNDQEQDSW